MRKIYIPILLFLSLGIAFLLGARNILMGDPMYLYDQVREMLLVKEIVVNQKLTLIGTHSGLGGFFHGPLWLYVLMPFFYFGGGNPLVFSTAYIILALAIVLTGYIIGSKLYNKTIGILVAFFLAITPRIWGYVDSTQSVHVTPLIYLLLFYFLIQYLRGKQYAFIFITFFTGLLLQFETASSVLLISLLPILYISIKILQNSSFAKHGLFASVKNMVHLKIILLSIFSFLLSISTFIIFDLRHKFLMLTSLFQYLHSSEKGKGYLIFSERIKEHFASLLDVYKSVLFDKLDFYLQILLVSIIVLAVFFLFKKNEEKGFIKEYFFFLVFPVIIFILFTIYPYPVYPEYVLGLTIPVVFVFSLSIQVLWKNNIGKIIVLLFFSLTINSVYQYIYNLYGKPYLKNNTAGSYINQKAVVDWVFQDANNAPFGYFVYSPDTFTYGMDYLFWWKGTRFYNYLPESKKQKQTYLIMYPPLEHDLGAHIFWKKNVIRTKESAIKRKVFKGDIVVEKVSIMSGEAPVDPNYYQNLIFR